MVSFQKIIKLNVVYSFLAHYKSIVLQLEDSISHQQAHSASQLFSRFLGHRLLESLYGRVEATEGSIGWLESQSSSALLSVVTEDLPAECDLPYILLMFRSET